jgi:hypothetical protein
MADQFTDLLSDYLDDEELSVEERRRIEAHLTGCTDCRATLADLSDVRAQAGTLADTPPEADLWPGVAARIGDPGHAQLNLHKLSVLPKRPAPRRFSFTMPQLVAAGLALMVLSGGTVWLARLGGSRTDFDPVSAEVHAPAQLPAPAKEIANRGQDAQLSDVRAVERYYDQAIAELQQTMDAGRGRLDPETLRVLEVNLQAIDRAIEQCRSALAADPGSVYLSTHLANAQRRKFTLLRRATALAAAKS